MLAMKIFRKFLIVGTILLVGLFGLYWILLRLLERFVLKTKPNGTETPASVGLDYEAFHIRSGNRHLQAWFVQSAPTNDAKKAVLIYHGVYESISEWIHVQHYLWEHGIASMVFDYSGFGNSQGRAFSWKPPRIFPIHWMGLSWLAHFHPSGTWRSR